MKRYKNTYAIYHLTEKHTTFNLGKLRVHVSFTGGIVTKKGVTPATFTTDDPVVQLAIEQSADYKKGVVKLLAQYAMEGEVKVGKNPKEAAPKGAMRETEQGDFTYGKEADASEAINREVAASPESINQEAATRAAEASGEAEQQKEGGSGEMGLEVVEASCKDVAKAYLQDHYGENPAPLRTRADVQACAAKYGITFKFD